MLTFIVKENNEVDERDKNKRQLWERDYKEESKENRKERESG